MPIIRRMLRTIRGNKENKTEIKLSDDLSIGLSSNDKSLREQLNDKLLNDPEQNPKK